MATNTSETYHSDEKHAISANEKHDSSIAHASDPEVERGEYQEEWRHGVDTKHEHRILRKLDLHLLPFVSLLYLLSFLYVSASSALQSLIFPPLGTARISEMQKLREWTRTSSSLDSSTISPPPSFSSSTALRKSQGRQIHVTKFLLLMPFPQ
jgi:hypothetical protein